MEVFIDIAIKFLLFIFGYFMGALITENNYLKEVIKLYNEEER